MYLQLCSDCLIKNTCTYVLIYTLYVHVNCTCILIHVNFTLAVYRHMLYTKWKDFGDFKSYAALVCSNPPLQNILVQYMCTCTL